MHGPISAQFQSELDPLEPRLKQLLADLAAEADLTPDTVLSFIFRALASTHSIEQIRDLLRSNRPDFGPIEDC